jgi:hypothetical protein
MKGSEIPMLLTSTVDILTSCVFETTYSNRNGKKGVSFQFVNVWGDLGTISQNTGVSKSKLLSFGFSLLI